jgi:hypothetical protein
MIERFVWVAIFFWQKWRQDVARQDACTQWLTAKCPLHFNRCPRQLLYYYTITMSVPIIYYSLNLTSGFKRHAHQILVKYS